jgi:DNA-binding MarR family transcriptional regulator/GNAT superfamily N-acetyltransferase
VSADSDGIDVGLTDSFREFNRFYTALIGSLSRSYLETEFSLQEARVIFEIANHPGCKAKEIQSHASFDQGYLSRVISRLSKAGVIRRMKSPDDHREQSLFLTKHGREAFEVLDQRANHQARELLRPLNHDAKEDLSGALLTIRRLLDPTLAMRSVTVRGQRAGDLGWVFQRHAITYKDEFGYSDLFESYVSEGLAPYLKNYDPKLDMLWIGEIGGRRVGSIAVQHTTDRSGWAKLRWLLVEKEARGLGLGSQLLNTAIQFCKKVGYEGIFLWTVSDLDAARRLYERAGFTLAHQKRDCPWASWAREQRWELRLGP